MSKQRRRHSAEQVVKKLRDADAMLAAGKSVGEVLQALEISEATLSRWRSQYGGMKSEEAKRLKQLEEENSRLKKLVAEQALDIQMLKEHQGKLTTPQLRRDAVTALQVNFSVSERRACRVLDQPRGMPQFSVPGVMKDWVRKRVT